MSSEEAPVALKPTPVKARTWKPAGPGHTILCAVLVVGILAGIVTLILFFVYRPNKPEFTVLGASLYDLNASSSTAGATVSASMQFTVRVHNPNSRSSAFFDRLAAYAVFGNEAITLPSPLPPLYLGKKGTGVVSPLLGGGVPLPVSPAAVIGLRAARGYGAVRLRLVFLGRVKHKAGPFHSPWYRVYTSCEVVMALSRKGIHGPATILGTPDCSVDI